MLNIVTSGLPLTAKEILSRAVSEVFGEDGTDIIDLSSDKLRSRVRMSTRNVGDVLVILDGVSSNKCKDIENGLYASDKYYEYTDDGSLVNFLNQKYCLSLSLGSQDSLELSKGVSSDNEELIERFRVQIADRDLLIRNLNCRITELSNIIENGEFPTVDVNDEELNKIKQENLDLHSQLSDVESEKKSLNDSYAELMAEKESLEKSVEKLKDSQKKAAAVYSELSAEHKDYKVKYSTMSGLLRTKDTEIEALKSHVAASSQFEEELRVVKDELELSKKHLASSRVENSQLKVDLSSKDGEIVQLKQQLMSSGLTESDKETLKGKISQAEKERDTYKKQVLELESELESDKSELDTVSQQLSEAVESLSTIQAERDSLKSKLKESDSKLASVDSTISELQSKVDLLEASTSRDTDIEEIYSKLSVVQANYDRLVNSSFGRVAANSSPKSSPIVKLIPDICRYSNIRFVYSGSTESRKGTYRSLLDEFRQLNPNERVVIVDATCETCVDYVFEIKKVVSGLNWFIKGGGIQRYLSDTCLPNVKVLSPGLSFINDSYFLNTDWVHRLSELENSGYNVVLYCGDISNLVGRVLHESFASCGTSMIYVHGNAIGARTIVSNIKGLSNSKSSIVCYFEFNKKVEKFYNMVAANNECRVVSML